MSTQTVDLDAPIWQPCAKCSGTGFLPEYAGIHQGVCFDCNGTRGKYTTQRKLDRNAKARERYAAKREEREAERIAKEAAKAAEAAAQVEAAKAAYAANNPEVMAALKVLGGKFGESLRDDFERTGDLTQNQARAAVRIAKEQATEPEAAPVPAGRLEVTGTVKTTKWVDNAYGGSLKMLVLDDRGFKVWGTVPSALEVDRGSRVTFKATLEASADDETFGFFKRPASASLVAA